MTTMFAKTIQDRKAASEQAQIEAEFAAERNRVVTELAALDARLMKEIPPFVKAIETTQAAADAARAALDQAEAKLRDARNAKRQAEWAIEQPRNLCRNRLESELLDSRIFEAIEQVDDLIEDCRKTASKTDSGAFYASLSKRLEWLAHTGRPGLLDLRYLPTAEIEPAIEKLLADLPVIGG